MKSKLNHLRRLKHFAPLRGSLFTDVARELAASFTTIKLPRTIHHHETDPITAVRRVSRRLG